MTEGPVFLFDFDQVDEHIFRAEAGLGAQSSGYPLEESLLLIDVPCVADRDLNDDEIIASFNAEIVRTIEEVVLLMLTDGDKEIVLRNGESLTESELDPVGQCLAIR